MTIYLNSLGTLSFTDTPIAVVPDESARKFYVLMQLPPDITGSYIVPVSYQNGQAIAGSNIYLWKDNLNIALDPKRKRLYGAPDLYEISGFGIKIYDTSNEFNLIDVIGYGGNIDLNSDEFSVPSMAVFDDLLVVGLATPSLGEVWVYDLVTKQSNYYPTTSYQFASSQFVYHRDTIFFTSAGWNLYWISKGANNISQLAIPQGPPAGIALDRNNARLYVPIQEGTGLVNIYSLASLPPISVGLPISLQAAPFFGTTTVIDNLNRYQYISTVASPGILMFDINSNQVINPQSPPIQPEARPLSIIEQDHVICAVYSSNKRVTLYQQTSS
ncbi:hypothetical protein [Brucella sp. IR073]|uniref:hypothetical protein n=1 Tax=unclassified Brucella TaxID=2632610 RepID=UPI003B9826ED